MSQRELFTTPRAAQYLGVSASTLNKLRVQSPNGPPYVKIGTAVRYDRADLDAWIEARKFRSTSEYDELARVRA